MSSRRLRRASGTAQRRREHKGEEVEDGEDSRLHGAATRLVAEPGEDGDDEAAVREAGHRRVPAAEGEPQRCTTGITDPTEIARLASAGGGSR